MSVPFNDAMHERCHRCHRPASHHRLTDKGNLYCLELNSRGRRRRDTFIKNDRHWHEDMVYFISPKFLQKGVFSNNDIGQTIWHGLNEYITG